MTVFKLPDLGEVFVLDDGSEVDLDLGNYERFLDIRLRSGQFSNIFVISYPF